MKIYIHDMANIYNINSKKVIDRIEFSNGAILYSKRSLAEIVFDPISLCTNEMFNYKFKYHTDKENIENELERLKFVALNSDIRNYIPLEDFKKEKEIIDVSGNKRTPFSHHCFIKGDLKLYELF